jgi:hypothetical protein
MKKKISENIIEIIIFFSFLIYFTFWIKTNYSTVNINNNSLSEAIRLTKITPYLSFVLLKISDYFNSSFILGYVIFPSLVAVILYKIFYRTIGSRLWALSITLLSMAGTENFPFIVFLKNIINFDLVFYTVNRNENFEILGFPIPSFSIFYFCILYYFSSRIIGIDKKIFTLTFFWSIGPLIHPLDGILGYFFWYFFILSLFFLKKINFCKKIIFFIILINIIIFFLIYNQISENEIFILKTMRNYPTYNFLVYFFLPTILMLLTFKFFKIDMREFVQKFLPIYLLMIIELFLILLSINGFGFDLQMLENRITMFLLHFLYYVPIIYYLNRDQFFLLKKKNYFSIENLFSTTLVLIFQKFSKFYLVIFSILIIIYFILSLKI